MLPSFYFKAYKSGEFRELSNLFGPVEWAYQRHKFKEGSAVFNWLLEGERKTREDEWDESTFDSARNGMKHDGKLASYTEQKDGKKVFATGLLAQMTSLIAKTPESTLARHRLAFILGTTGPVSKEFMNAWHSENVKPQLSDEEKLRLMKQLLHDKYTTNENYKNLLLSTHERVLHEAKGRGAPGFWEYQDLSEEKIAKGFSSGGDWLGKLIMTVRQELTATPQV